jgi:hypothetical protein
VNFYPCNTIERADSVDDIAEIGRASEARYFVLDARPASVPHQSCAKLPLDSSYVPSSSEIIMLANYLIV